MSRETSDLINLELWYIQYTRIFKAIKLQYHFVKCSFNLMYVRNNKKQFLKVLLCLVTKFCNLYKDVNYSKILSNLKAYVLSFYVL